MSKPPIPKPRPAIGARVFLSTLRHLSTLRPRATRVLTGNPPSRAENYQSAIDIQRSLIDEQQSSINNLKSKTSPRVHTRNPKSPSSPWLNCPVCQDARRISTISQDMIRSIRKLRRDLKACKTCPVAPNDCPILQNLNSQIQTAVQHVVDEWDLKL